MMLRRSSTVFLSVFAACVLLRSASSSSSSTAPVSPIPGWGPSWAASAAHGTTLALSCCVQLDNNEQQSKQREERNGVLVLMRRTSTTLTVEEDSASLLASRRQPPIVVDGLLVFPYGSDQAGCFVNGNAPRWTLLGDSTVCFMTGFESDIDHLLRVLHQDADHHRIIFEGDTPIAVPHLDTHDDQPRCSPVASLPPTVAWPTMRMAQSLAKELRAATLPSSSRPYGVQALLVGRPLQIFTLDPSGGLLHWGSGATAIGRHAKLVRQHLYEGLQKQHGTRDDKDNSGISGMTALKIAIRAMLLSLDDASVSFHNDHYEVLLTWRDKEDRMYIGRVHPDVVSSSRESIQEALTAKNIS